MLTKRREFITFDNIFIEKRREILQSVRRPESILQTGQTRSIIKIHDFIFDENVLAHWDIAKKDIICTFTKDNIYLKIYNPLDYDITVKKLSIPVILTGETFTVKSDDYRNKATREMVLTWRRGKQL